MLTVIIVIHLMLVLGMIGVVLLQKSEGGGLVSSSNSGFMTGRGTANVLTRTTALLAVGFFVTSLALSWLAGLGRHPASIINTGGSPTSQEAPGGVPSAPLSQSGRGVLDQLGGSKSGGANAPAAPSGPQVPQSR
jgi:preprotein translocase subunit SecG